MRIYCTEIAQRRAAALGAPEAGEGDAFAALRQAVLSAEAPVTALPLGGQVCEASFEQQNELARLVLLEHAWSQYAMRATVTAEDLSGDMTPYERAAALRGLCRSRAAIDPCLLIAQLGHDAYINALVRDAVRRSIAPDRRAGCTAALRERLREPFGTGELHTSVLDIAAEHRLALVPDHEIARRMDAWLDAPRPIAALLRALLVTAPTSLETHLRDLLWRGLPADAGTAADAIAALQRLPGSGHRGFLRDLDARWRRLGLSPGHLALISAHLGATPTPQREPGSVGLTVMQTMLQGAWGREGRGDAGGLSVFLRSLGRALANHPDIHRVVTVVLDDQAGADGRPVLWEDVPGHSVLRLRVAGGWDATARGMASREPALSTSLAWALQRHAIVPDLIHVRYASSASRAVAALGRAEQIPVFFTVTTDPHQQLAERFDREGLSSEDSEALTEALHAVHVADDLLELADALIAMPRPLGIQPLLDYFPQLAAEGRMRSRAVRLLPEGIAPAGNRSPRRAMRDILADHLQSPAASRAERARRLSPERLCKPTLLSVGRLAPIKQLPLLVEAWVTGELWRRYNLILVGGDLDRPSATEQGILRDIERVLARHPDARDGFCMTGALPNDRVRELEAALAREADEPGPSAYVCASTKEEFGIAVLEAMTAGLPVFGPLRGGLASYIEEGRSGFLMDTRSAASMRSALQKVLLDDGAAATLRAVARRGRDAVVRRYGIDEVAQRLALYYGEAIDRAPRPAAG